MVAFNPHTSGTPRTEIEIEAWIAGHEGPFDDRAEPVDPADDCSPSMLPEQRKDQPK